MLAAVVACDAPSRCHIAPYPCKTVASVFLAILAVPSVAWLCAQHSRHLQQAAATTAMQTKVYIPPVVLPAAGLQKLGKVSVGGAWLAWYQSAEAEFAPLWNDLIRPLFPPWANLSRVLEVAAGACRNTERLLPLAEQVVVTDIDPAAVDLCKMRFSGRPGAEKLHFIAVDGIHIPLSDGSVSFVYQFDAGVHFHSSVIRGYMKEFNRVLVRGGVGFFHHSNLGASQYSVNDDLDVTANPHMRSNFTRATFSEIAREEGLRILCHPLVDWYGSVALDAFALFCKPDALGCSNSSAAFMASTNSSSWVCPAHLATARFKPGAQPFNVESAT